MKHRINTLSATLLLWGTSLAAQQVPDTSWVFPLKNPRHAPGKGSTVLVDAAHHNFHTLQNRYSPFGKALAADGYRVKSNDAPFAAAALQECRVLVVSNPLDSSNIGSWRLPNPSAFSPAEIQAIHDWVQGGGRLLLIADHMPFAGAAQALARAFGFEFQNCFALDNRHRNTERFLLSNQTLVSSTITQGVDTVVTFTGSAFQIPRGATPILVLKNYTLTMPRVAWQFEEDTPTLPSEGYFQGAYTAYGKGRIVVMGEAAMFTAQLTGPNRNPVGMNQPEARQNNQLLLNIIRWLDE